MVNIVRNVRDIDADDRHAIEHVFGQSLRDNQRLVIQLSDIDAAEQVSPTNSRPPQTLPDWTNVYEGLNDDEIADFEKIFLTRADLTRPM